MIRAAAIILILAAPATGAQTIVEGGPEWLDKRAEVFSSVCMAAAPDFAAFDAKAEAAGLERIEQGWHLPPEAFLSLRAHDGFCSCFMTVGAPDQTEMVGAIFGRLMQDWGRLLPARLKGWPMSRHSSGMGSRRFRSSNRARLTARTGCPRGSRSLVPVPTGRAANEQDAHAPRRFSQGR
ncbi:hypothetical protein KU6B_23790 [Mameliella alba]|nr:hypothetical protein KU6B_23790 [Mameliella alba]